MFQTKAVTQLELSGALQTCCGGAFRKAAGEFLRIHHQDKLLPSLSLSRSHWPRKELLEADSTARRGDMETGIMCSSGWTAGALPPGESS